MINAFINKNIYPGNLNVAATTECYDANKEGTKKLKLLCYYNI